MLNRLSKYISSNPINRIFNLGKKTVAWKKVTDLKPGMKIAIADSGVEFDEIVSIKAVGQEQVYDIEVENTHNFVGNGILAHNTIIAGNITPEATGTRDIGTSSLYWNNLYVNNVIAPASGISGYWQRNSGAIAPTNLTDDLLLGTTATSSALFAFKNIASGTPTASISGNSAGRALVIDGLGNITTTAMSPITIGSASTGPIALNPKGTTGLYVDGTGQVGIGTAGPDATAILDLTSTTKGFLAPRMTTTQRDAISTPATGLFVYNTTTNQYNVFNGTTWGAVGGGGGAWSDLTVPTANLTLAMDADTTTFNWATGTSTNNLFSFTTDASANGTGSLVNIQTGASATVLPFRIRAGAVEGLMVNASGNVGIGITSPLYKLDVTGTASVSADMLIGGQTQLGRFASTPTAVGRGSVIYNAGTDTVNYYNGSSWLTLANTSNNSWTDGGTYLYPTAYESLRIYDAGGTDYLDLSHDGTNATFTSVNTTKYTFDKWIDITGALTSSGNLDINGTANDIAGTLNLSGNTLTSASDLTINAGGTKTIISDDLQISGGDILGASGNIRITVVDALQRTDITGLLSADRGATFSAAIAADTPLTLNNNSGALIYKVSNAGLVTSGVTDSSTAIAFNLDTSNTLSTQGSKLLSLKNATTEKFYIDKDGNLYTAGTIISGNGMGQLFTNKSGGTVTNRSLVTLDTSNNSSFTTTVVPYSRASYGVLIGVGLGASNDVNGDGICSANDVCMIAQAGEVEVLLTNAASAVRGDYIFTSATAGSGVSSAKQFDGLIGIVSNTSGAGSGYVKMIFKVQPQISGSPFLNTSNTAVTDGSYLEIVHNSGSSVTMAEGWRYNTATAKYELIDVKDDALATGSAQVNFNTEGNYTQENMAYAVTLTPSATSGDITLTLGSGTWNADARVQQYCRVSGNSGVATLTAAPAAQTTITATTTTAFANTSAIASGSWYLYCTNYTGSTAQLNSLANSNVGTFATTSQGQLPAVNHRLGSVIATIGGTQYSYVVGGNGLSTVYKATIDTSGNIGTYATTSQAQLPHTLGYLEKNVITLSVGGTQYLYTLGGDGPSGYISTVYKATIDTSANVGTFSTTSQGQLPAAIGIMGSTTATIGGTTYLYVTGGWNSGAKSTVYKATIDGSGNIGTFATTSQGQLPATRYGHGALYTTVGGTQYLYIVGGNDGAVYTSTVYRATVDSSGNVGTFATTSQAQLPQVLGYLGSNIVSIGGTSYIYLTAGTNNSAAISTIYKATIDSSGNVGTFATTSQGQLPTTSMLLSSPVTTIGGTMYIYAIGGQNSGAANLSTVYKATIGPDANPTSTTYSIATAGDQISTTSWSDINDVDVTETLNSQTIYYSVSFDGRTTFYIYDATTSNNGWRPIVRNNASTWQYNSNTTAGVDKVTWTNATYNSQNGALSQAYGVTVNQMSGTTLGALTDLNWNEINGYTPTTNTLDFSAGFKSSSSTQNPQVDGINVKYTKAGYKIVEVDSNTSRLYNYSGATQNLKFGVIPQGGGGSPGAGNGLWTNNNASVANGSYIEVAHNQSTNDLVTNGWIYDGAKWIEINDQAKTDHNTQDPKLLSWYKMEEASGDLDNAQGTAARDLIDLNTPTYQATGRVNKAITFDGTNDYFCTGSGTTCADADTLDFAAADSFTLGGWFKHNTIATNPDYMVTKGPKSAFTVDTSGTLGTNLLGYWNLNETSGTLVDSAGAYDGTATGTTSVAGKQGNARDFDGSSDKVQTSNPIISGTGDFSITAWIKRSSTGTTDYIAGNYGIGCTTGIEWYVSSTNVLRTYISGGVSGATTLNSATWYHVAITRTSGTVKLYVNGTEDGTGSLASSIGNSCNWAIGNGPDYTSEAFGGTIDEVSVWDKAISTQEITDLYNSGNANTCTDDCNIGGPSYKLYMENDGDLTFGIDDDAASFPEDSATSTVATYDDNAWHHVAAVKNGTTNIKLYVDGEEVASDTSISATGTLANSGPFYLGIDSDATSNPWAGQLDEMFTYSRALTAGEIAELYRSNRRFAVEQTDANTVRLYNYSGSAQNLRLDVITGGLGRNSGTVSLAPAAADTDSQDSTNSLWINKTGLNGSILKLQKSGSDIFNISQAGGNAALVLDQRLGGDIFTASASGSTKFTIANSGAVTSGVNDAAITVSDGTGGTITHSGGYTIHTFNSSSTFVPSTGLSSVEVLVVAGGGAGSAEGAGGGGGLIYKSSHGITTTSYPVTVGSGGSAATTCGTNGGISSALGLTAIGGGGGGCGATSYNGVNGGSGGGEGGSSSATFGTGTQPSQSGDSGTYGFGNNGGSGFTTPDPYAGGGGGGAGAAAVSGNTTTSRNGGAGKDYSISGTSVGYAGGGGGGAYDSAFGTASHGGGVGGRQLTSPSSPAAGTANTGGGGGGMWNSAGAAGGSGVVIIRYLTNQVVTNTTDVLTLDHSTTGTATNGIGTGILFRAEDTGGSIENAGRISGILANATNGSEQSALTFDTRGVNFVSDVGTFSTTSQGQLPQILETHSTITTSVGGTQYIYVTGGWNGAYISTIYKATIDSSGNIGAFATTSQSQLPGILGYHSTITASIGGTQYVYVTGGKNTSSYLSTIYKATIDSSGNIGAFATTSQSQLPQTLRMLSTVTASIGGTQYVYVTGGYNGTAYVSTIYKATIDSSGNIGAFATTSQSQLPGILGQHSTVTTSIGGTQYVYVTGGYNGADVSTIYKAAIDTSGNIGTFSTTSQGQLPQILSGLSTVITSIGGTQYVYVTGGTNGGANKSTIYKAAIDTSGNIGTFSTTSQGQLPQIIGGPSTVTATIGGTQYVYVTGGNNGATDVSTVYKATIGPDTGSSTLTRRMKLDHAGNLTISGTITQSGSPDIAENVRVSDESIEGGDVVMIDNSPLPPLKLRGGGSYPIGGVTESPRDDTNTDIYNRFVAKKADVPYSKQLLGVISSDPGIILNSSKNVVYDGLKSQSNERPLAIAGRVPVKIDPDSAAFDAGDPLTASTKPGFAQKATKSGFVIGKSLEDWSTGGPDRILALIQYGYVSQELVLDKNQNLDVQFAITPIASRSATTPSYQILDSLGQAVNQVGVFSDAAIANMKVGLVAADKITAKTITIEDLLISPIADIDLLRVKNLIAENATVSGTLIAERLVSPTLDQINNQLSLVTSQFSSASAIISSIQAKYTSFGAINNASTSGDPLNTSHLYQENATIADLNVTGSLFANVLNSNDCDNNSPLPPLNLRGGGSYPIGGVTCDPTLYIQPLASAPINLLAGLMTLTPDGNVTINGNLNVTGSVLARDITSGKSNVDQLSANKLSLNDLTITTASATESASVGFSTIASSSAEIFIPNSKVSENTLIYVTPIGNTNNQVLYVKEKLDGLGFTVAVPSTPSADLRFNYWLIKTQ